MYFVDRDVLNKKLDYIDNLSHQVESSEAFALERVCHMLIESVVDVGNMIIDGFIMRDPGSYQDVLDIMEMEKVITPTHQKAISSTLPLRQWFVRDYVDIDHAEVKRVFLDNIQAYQSFKSEVSAFIDNELGPVSAFGKGGTIEEV